jgi:hypothetical protein
VDYRAEPPPPAFSKGDAIGTDQMLRQAGLGKKKRRGGKRN